MASEKKEVVDFCREGGPQLGDILYWDGNEWVCLPSGIEGQILGASVSGFPEWIDAP